ncbi:NADH dehydrogenase [Desulfuribacillus stibiiarsenatis]|uniref:NAD(P)H dehydrogenase subunit J n=1 Tax=Desulfuribacillus stibiiarsenatis TaxID=1390249 RepID=A0A1E5L5V1_9FIRM|nr:NADH-quinone oxidoreductase subunit C [Desulfuribacillus stibiiarsenatis]OEH85444.1 NADH dehydrogenase [Desulfuribacillus stibiiarsenatis]
MSQEVLNLIIDKVKSIAGPDAIIDSKLNFDIPYVVLDSSSWTTDLANMLKQDDALQFDFLCFVSGVDYKEHMEVVYQLHSLNKDQYIMLKIKTSRENPSVISVASVWGTADWHEREAYDLLGIDFVGHPNLTRILLEDDWEGHPLRKDYNIDKETLGLD